MNDGSSALASAGTGAAATTATATAIVVGAAGSAGRASASESRWRYRDEAGVTWTEVTRVEPAHEPGSVRVVLSITRTG